MMLFIKLSEEGLCILSNFGTFLGLIMVIWGNDFTYSLYLPVIAAFKKLARKLRNRV